MRDIKNNSNASLRETKECHEKVIFEDAYKNETAKGLRLLKPLASLFPGCSLLQEYSRSIVSVICPKTPKESLTKSPHVIDSSKSVFSFAQGEKKWAILASSLEQQDDITTLQVRLFLGATCILDTDEMRKLYNNYGKHNFNSK